MYESFFGFRQRPFASIPDLACVVACESFQSALDALAISVERGQGIGVLTAPAGLGKSLLCQKLAEELRDNFRCILLVNSNFPSRRSLLQAVLHELGHDCNRMSEQELRFELTSVARTAHESEQPLVLIVDEAHLLSSRLLEEIRTISNLSESGDPLVRIVLSGQLELEEKLAEPELQSLSQRVHCQVDLQPLTRQESADYIAARLKSAGTEPAEVFTSEALEMIAHVSDGSPRCLNQLCDHSLLLACAAEQKPVDAEIVHESLQELKQLPLHWNEPLPTVDPFAQDAVRTETSDQAENDEIESDVEFDLSSAGEVSAIEVGCDVFEFESTAAPQPETPTKPPESPQAEPAAAAATDQTTQENEAAAPSPADGPRVKFGTYTGPPRPASGKPQSRFGVTLPTLDENGTFRDGETIVEIVQDRYAQLDALRSLGAEYTGIVWNIAPARLKPKPAPTPMSVPNAADNAIPVPEESPATDGEQPAGILATPPTDVSASPATPAAADVAADDASLEEVTSAAPAQPVKPTRSAAQSREQSALERLDAIEAAVSEALRSELCDLETALEKNLEVAPFYRAANAASESAVLREVYEIGTMTQTLVFDSLAELPEPQPADPSPAPLAVLNGEVAPPELGHLGNQALPRELGHASFNPVKAHAAHPPRKYSRLFSQLRRKRQAERESKAN